MGGTGSGTNGAGCQVLVVEDETPIRVFAERILVAAGYRVSVVSDGDEAWTRFERDRHAIGAVLLDHRTPGMPTERLVREMRTLHPQLVVVLSSGFVEEDVRERLRTCGVSAFLEKPWTREELLATLAEAIDTAAR
jgi:CheY-like chemotaxis protein